MFVYVFKRVLLMIPTLFGAAVLVFLLMRLIPGDVCVLRLATGGGMDPQVLRNCRAEIGTD
jgi:peptide/nickel transport system permease protein